MKFDEGSASTRGHKRQMPCAPYRHRLIIAREMGHLDISHQSSEKDRSSRR